MSDQCWVCHARMPGLHEHHVWPRSDGGHDGPLATLCANCHGCVHGALERAKRGRDPITRLAHLQEEPRTRAMTLVQIALGAHLNSPANPHPTLTVLLDERAYLEALDRFKLDRGFTSRAATVNAMLRELAVVYGLKDANPPPNPAKRTRLSAFRGTGPERPRALDSRASNGDPAHGNES